MQRLLPSYASMVELLEAECQVHHDGARADKLLRHLHLAVSEALRTRAPPPPGSLAPPCAPQSALCAS